MRLVVFGHERGRTWTHTHKDRALSAVEREERTSATNQVPPPAPEQTRDLRHTLCVLTSALFRQ
jgi:hypothetical protein